MYHLGCIDICLIPPGTFKEYLVTKDTQERNKIIQHKPKPNDYVSEYKKKLYETLGGRNVLRYRFITQKM